MADIAESLPRGPHNERQWVPKDVAARVLAGQEGHDGPLSERTLRDRARKGKLESRHREGRVEYLVKLPSEDVASDAGSVSGSGGNGSERFAELLAELRGERDYLRQQNSELLTTLQDKEQELRKTRERLDGVLALFAAIRQPLPGASEEAAALVAETMGTEGVLSGRVVGHGSRRRWWQFWR